MEEIILQYEPHVSKAPLDAFKTQLTPAKVRLVNSKDLEHFDFDPSKFVADVTLFLSRHSTELLLGVLGNLLTGALVTLYQALIKSSKGKKIPSIEINLSTKESHAKFVVKDAVSDDATTKCFEEFKQIVQSEKLKSDLKNDSYLNPSRIPSIEYRYDAVSKLWLPGDYEQYKGVIRKANEDVNNWPS